jgi:NAD(P)-dependent dehydrogenase (short-subunit alcohol dehydrogenase family)
MNAMRLSGKVAIITGAGMGIGAETARVFAREGAKVIIADINPEAGESVAGEIREAGGEAIFVRTDVTSEESVKQVVEATFSRHGRLDVMFNNAGINFSKPTCDVTVEEWDRVMAVNLRGPFLGCKYALPVMARQGSGSVINTSSNAGLVGRPNYGCYSASKGGVEILTKSLAIDYAKYKVRVNTIAPGSILTPLAETIFASKPDPAAAKRSLAEACPMKELGRPSDIAYAALYLASDDARYVTGHTLRVDGGRTAGIVEPEAFHEEKA